MAETKKTTEKIEKAQKQQNAAAEKEERKKQFLKEESHEMLIRIMGYDIPGSKTLYAGLTRIKGISWGISNGLCIKLGFQRTKRISELTKDDIQKIEKFLHELDLPVFLKNRRNDFESGETAHYFGSDLDIKREFDIKRLREIKSYKGIRHALKQPVRGQRTRSHFRKSGGTMGIKKKKE